MKGTHVSLVMILLLTGCSTSKEEILPTGHNTMRDIWQSKVGEIKTEKYQERAIRRGLTGSDNPPRHLVNKSDIQQAKENVQHHFPRLPNPDMVIYIYPHFVGSEPTPIPSYSTVFPFYSKVQYALPNERVEAY
ncbi:MULTISPECIES: TIGR03751 family conjugal transfer lipoprotein [Proteus]|uniref:TIGR03751 family conjugal transfer lipoprotein n=1 Tax=Proteus faecis TaxID=2050967 RepID=A0AAW7CV20_9GAMM|nr:MULTISPECIES: TIGR03751 family conjugal transfer lipoprotein [Proteus]MDH7535197.1 TIGR03751 family conjugal transfer lipoprotein [Proteus mirabilis]MDL5167615.1 TIGR03751 family conjugal transfer lipoprotein [Proteus faecis]MDL5275499.1 TIGR03751 family conjugal transfer lipoprotein [Proteus faecis]MDL5279232.1 TIGR03751 family conjugal transfer lipoprotein [Proteus faecis]MDL5308233.1 TIGR03751 family conjugal transfer lipoprotein [Proteus faecis]